jgi:hypothetical protein
MFIKLKFNKVKGAAVFYIYFKSNKMINILKGKYQFFF